MLAAVSTKMDNHAFYKRKRRVSGCSIGMSAMIVGLGKGAKAVHGLEGGRAVTSWMCQRSRPQP
jgi:hypothetical protein